MSRGKKPKPVPTIDTTEILKNSVNSIQLGIEDYEASNHNSARALSAARNIYSGVLLLFKYKIASLAKSSDEVAELIYINTEIKPTIDSSGKITWKPIPNPPRTIDTREIRIYLEGLNIYHDWNAVEQLQKCRNELEHLHTLHPTSSIQAAITALFPMLRRFITEELKAAPAVLLGKAWEIMLNTHEFYLENQKRITQEWIDLSLPNAAADQLSSTECRCCDSTLLQPLKEDVQNSVSVNDPAFRLECLSCHQPENLKELLESNFTFKHEHDFDNTEHVRECKTCTTNMYLIDTGRCYWCGAFDSWPKCAHCKMVVSELDDALCERCAEDEWMFQNR